MSGLKISKNNSYYHVSGLPDGSERFLACSRFRYPKQLGIASATRVWLTGDDPTITIFDVVNDEEVATLRLAPDPVGYYPWYPNISRSRDGKLLYATFQFRNSEGSIGSLTIIDVQEAKIIATHEFGEKTVLKGALERPDGKLIIPRNRGAVLFDPSTGEKEHSIVEGTRLGWFHSPNPQGTILLRWEVDHLPTTDIKTGPRVWPFGSRERYYGKVIQVWSAFPLRFERRIVTEWLHLDDLVDERLSVSAQNKNPEARNLKREVWDAIADTSAKFGASETEVIPNDFPLNFQGTHPHAKLKSWENIAAEIRGLERHGSFLGWQPDGTAFWTQHAGFVSCLGVDGTSSGRIGLGRFGTRKGTILRATEHPRLIEPLNSRRAKINFLYGQAHIQAPASKEVFEPSFISEVDDGWIDIREYRKVSDERFEEQKTKDRTHSFPLHSKSEKDCIAAIEAVTEWLDSDLHKKSDGCFIDLSFTLSGEQMTERAFFKYVGESVPSASPMLERMLEKYIETGAHLHCDEGKAPALGYGAQALARIGKSNSGVLRLYADSTMKDEHPPFDFWNKTISILQKSQGWSDNAIRLMVWFMMKRHTEGIDYRESWESWGLGEAVMAHLSPQEFANIHDSAITEVMPREIAMEWLEGEPDRFPYDIFREDIASSIPDNKNPWIKSFLAELDSIYAQNIASGKWKSELEE